MCGRYTNTLSASQLEEHFGLPFPTVGSERYNVAPTEEIAAITTEGVRVLRWGLLPHWSRDRRAAARMINARSETAAQRSAYRDLIASARSRALIVADGWYEWLHAEDPRAPRTPMRFTVDDGAPFAFAGLWTSARIEGERIESATIMTCSAAANRIAAAVHDRMPVVLADRDSQRAWLSPAVDARAALSLCVALPAQRTRVAAANPRVNRSGLDEEGPDLLVAPAERST